MLCEGAVVGRIMKAAAAAVGQPWLWTLAYGHQADAGCDGGYLSGKLSGLMFQKVLSAGRSGRI